MTKQEIISKSFMISDNIAMQFCRGSTRDIHICAINMNKINYKAFIRLKDLAVLKTNMGDKTLKRVIDAIVRNKELIEDELREMMHNA